MIKNIIFDFGGVIYDIDHQKTKDAFTDLGISNFEELYGHTIQTGLFEEFEIGLISPSDFRMAIREYLPTNRSDESINNAWNALLIGFKNERIELLSEIRKHYRVLLLSNTNQIHYLKYMLELKRQNLYEKFIGLFDKLYFSHQIGMRKPDHKIFDFILLDNSIKAEETLFIDDYEANIYAANEMNIIGYLLKPEQDMLNLFTKEGRLK